MFVRFVLSNTFDSSTHCEDGVFQTAYRLRREKELPDDAHSRLSELLRWFRENLEVPNRFARSQRAGADPKAICWFKPEAAEHIANLREIAEILNDHGYPTEMITTSRTGYVVFEDDHQVVAQPFRDAR